MPKLNKFDELKRDDLLKLCLEQENELEQLRPRPPKFKLGQVLFSQGKNAYNWAGQPGTFFVVLSVENRMGKWYYGYAKAPGSAFHAFPEEKLRAATALELTGMDQPQATITESGPNQNPTTQTLNPNNVYPNASYAQQHAQLQHLAFDIETADGGLE